MSTRLPTSGTIRTVLLITLLAVFLSGCGAPLVAGMPVSAASLQGTLRDPGIP